MPAGEQQYHNACPMCANTITGTQGARRKSPLLPDDPKRIDFYRNQPCGCTIDTSEWRRIVGPGAEDEMNVSWIRVSSRNGGH